MNKQFLVGLTISLLLGAGDDESTRALATWQGSWTLVSSEVNGESATEQPNPPSLRVSTTQYVTEEDGQQKSYTIRLEPSTDPKGLELTREDGPAKGQILKGIYKLEGDLLTVCHGMTPENDRPVEFSTGAESGHTLIVWRRVKPKAGS